MDNRINYVMVLDTETANNLDYPLVYDIGGTICDKSGNIYETFSFVIRDIFRDERDLMQTAYYAEKIPTYWKEIWEGRRKLVSFYSARKYIIDLMREYNINTVYAYNASFDLNALNITHRWLSKSKYRYFFPYGTKINCIWSMATQTLCKRKTYIDFCEENALISNRGRNYSTSAETVYKYLHLNPDYAEEHRGLDDALIETEIMARCYASHKAMPHGKGIRRNCWMDVKRAVK